MASDRLSALDTSFLHLEDAGAHMHVASLLIFKGPPPSQPELLAHVRNRLHLVPRFRQKLAFVPFDQGRPVWIDDPHLNLEYHVRHASLPPPGSDKQIKAFAGRVLSQRLDRTKPLWEIWLVQGLQKDRFALIGKSHHCLVDGVSGVDITTVLFDTEPKPKSQPMSDEPLPGPQPSSAQLLGEALLERALNPREVVRGVRASLRAPRAIASRVFEDAAHLGAFAWAGLKPAPRTPLNVPVGSHRRFTWSRNELANFKEVKNALGGTVNDVVLAVVAGALRSFMESRGVETEGLEIKALVPVSVRAEPEKGALGNRVAAMMAPLPVYEDDPVERLRLVRQAMGHLKETKQAVGAQVLTELGGFANSTILGQAARLQSRQRFFNLVVTNIPGPQFPLYLLGREMIDLFPMAPLAKNLALVVAIMSYNGRLNFGLVGDFDRMYDLEQFADDLKVSVDELEKAARRTQLKRKPRAKAKSSTYTKVRKASRADGKSKAKTGRTQKAGSNRKPKAKGKARSG